MKHVVTRELFAYWDRLRGGRSAPERSEIDPAVIRGILADTFIVEVDQTPLKPQFRIRLSGTRMNALYMAEMKGASFLDLVRHQDQTILRQLTNSVLDERRPAVAGIRAGPPDHPRIDLEMLLLPLRHNGRTHTRILGALAPIAVPTWLGLIPVEPPVLGAWRLHQDDDTETTGLEQPNGPYGRPGTSKVYGYLIVHQGGR